MKLKLITVLGLIMLSLSVQSQHVIGFFPNWRNAGDENNIQYDKITDIIYCFIQPNSTGTFPTFSSWPSGDQTKFNNIKLKAKAKGVKIRVSSGGAGSASLYSPIAANATYRNNFATSVADFIVANDIDGFDIDWEFPATNETGNLDLLVQAFKTAFDAKQTAGYRKIYLGIDVGGELGHTAYFSKNFVNYVDEVNIMAYDLAGGFSTTALTKTAFDVWKTYLGAANASKLVVGIPFYTPGWLMYNQLANPYSTNAANAYNGTLSGSNGSTYNAAPCIKEKIDYVMQNGGSGVMIWELSQDILDPSYYQYSLLSAINIALTPYMGPTCSKPILGGNKSLCGTGGSITQVSGLTSQSYRTFTWYKNNVVTGGNTSSLTITTPGTYKVKVDSAGACNTKDSIVISSTIGTVNLGSTVSLCSPSIHMLDAGLQGTGLNYQWYKDGNILLDEINKTYKVRRGGLYKVEVSASGCSTVNGSVNITSTLPNIDDVKRCGTGPVTLSVINPGSDDFEWYDAITGGNLLHTGTSYSPTVSSTKSYFVVKKGAVIGSNCIGIPVWDANTIYLGTNTAVYNNKKYTAQWWTKGDLPTSLGVWLDNGSCGTPGCDRMEVVATISTCTDLDETTNLGLIEFSLIPNPVVGNELRLNFVSNVNDKIEVSIIDITGNKVESVYYSDVQMGNNTIKLDASNLISGLYLVKIKGSKMSSVQKLIKE